MGPNRTFIVFRLRAALRGQRQRSGGTRLGSVVFPGRFAREIPEAEKYRGGFDATPRLSNIVDEYNQDVTGRLFRLESEPPTGHFS